MGLDKNVAIAIALAVVFAILIFIMYSFYEYSKKAEASAKGSERFSFGRFGGFGIPSGFGGYGYAPYLAKYNYQKPAPPPPPKPAYTFHQGMDRKQDIPALVWYSWLTNNIPELKKECDSRPECVGFNTGGQFFTELGPKSEWIRWASESEPTLGLYVKN